MMSLYEQHAPKRGMEEESAYYYWFQFLRLVPEYNESHRLWTDFGDVKNLEFDVWWHRYGVGLFKPAERVGVSELLTEESVTEAREAGAYVLKIDPTLARKYLIEQLRVFLDEKGVTPHAGRKSHAIESGKAKYTFVGRPEVITLKRCLAIYHELQKVPKPSNYDIGVAVGLKPSAVVPDNCDKETALILEGQMYTAMSNQVRKLKHLIKGVGEGRFPVLY